MHVVEGVVQEPRQITGIACFRREYDFVFDGNFLEVEEPDLDPAGALSKKVAANPPICLGAAEIEYAARRLCTQYVVDLTRDRLKAALPEFEPQRVGVEIGIFLSRWGFVNRKAENC